MGAPLVTRGEAVAACSGLGGKLPGFRDPRTLQWALDEALKLANKTPGMDTPTSDIGLWLGGVRGSPSSVPFKWDDGTPMGFEPWSNNPTVTGQCVVMRRNVPAFNLYGQQSMALLPTSCNGTNYLLCAVGAVNSTAVTKCPAAMAYLPHGVALDTGCRIWPVQNSSRCVWNVTDSCLRATTAPSVEGEQRHYVLPLLDLSFSAIASTFCVSTGFLAAQNNWIAAAILAGNGPQSYKRWNYKVVDQCTDARIYTISDVSQVAPSAAHYCTDVASVVRRNLDKLGVDASGRVFYAGNDFSGNELDLEIVSRCKSCIPYVVRSPSVTLNQVAEMYNVTATEVAVFSNIDPLAPLAFGSTVYVCQRTVPDPCAQCRDLNCWCSCNMKAPGKYYNPWDPQCRSFVTCGNVSGVSFPVGFSRCPANKVFDPLSKQCLTRALLPLSWTCPLAKPCDNGLCFCAASDDGWHKLPWASSNGVVECKAAQLLQVVLCNSTSRWDNCTASCVPAEWSPRRLSRCASIECLCELRVQNIRSLSVAAAAPILRFPNIFDPAGRTIVVCRGSSMMEIEACPWGEIPSFVDPHLPLDYDPLLGISELCIKPAADYVFPYQRAQGCLGDYDAVAPTPSLSRRRLQQYWQGDADADSPLIMQAERPLAIPRQGASGGDDDASTPCDPSLAARSGRNLAQSPCPCKTCGCAVLSPTPCTYYLCKTPRPCTVLHRC